LLIIQAHKHFFTLGQVFNGLDEVFPETLITEHFKRIGFFVATYLAIQITFTIAVVCVVVVKNQRCAALIKQHFLVFVQTHAQGVSNLFLRGRAPQFLLGFQSRGFNFSLCLANAARHPVG